MWSALSGRCELTLHAGHRTAAGRVGLLALQTLKVRRARCVASILTVKRRRAVHELLPCMQVIEYVCTSFLAARTITAA